MKKNFAKVAMTLCLLGALGVGATLAYTSAKSNVVENTFTAGDGLKDKLELDEANWDDENNTYDVDDRVLANSYTDLMEGDELYKDPIVHLLAPVPDCYLFINVSGADDLADKGVTISDTDNALGSTWVKYDGSTTIDGIYYLSGYENNIVPGSTIPRDWLVFRYLDVDDNIFDEEGVSRLDGVQINVQAAAIQARNYSLADAYDFAEGMFD